MLPMLQQRTRLSRYENSKAVADPEASLSDGGDMPLPQDLLWHFLGLKTMAHASTS
jgi:hypothetical protein